MTGPLYVVLAFVTLAFVLFSAALTVFGVTDRARFAGAVGCVGGVFAMLILVAL